MDATLSHALHTLLRGGVMIDLDFIKQQDDKRSLLEKASDLACVANEPYRTIIIELSKEVIRLRELIKP